MYTGGYSASCAAMSYPDIGAVVILAQPTPCVHNVLFLSLQILDATFDKLYPLVKARVSPYLGMFNNLYMLRCLLFPL